jgi:hypothetical protein
MKEHGGTSSLDVTVSQVRITDPAPVAFPAVNDITIFRDAAPAFHRLLSGLLLR